MKPTKITDLTIKNTTERMTIGDGLFITEAKQWRWNYRFAGKQKTMSYGQYPDVGLAMAKDKHNEARKKLASGVDPMAEKKAEKQKTKREHANDFKSVFDAYVKWWKPTRDAAYVDDTVDDFKKDVLPIIGHMPITQIEAPEVIAIGKRIEKRGAPETARRVLSKLSGVFGWAVANGIAKRNPCRDFRRSQVLQPTNVVNFPRIEIKDVPTLLTKMDDYSRPVMRLALKLLLHTFARPGKEFLGWRWSEIDWHERTWTIPAERMKKRRIHVVPLSTQTIALLKQLQKLTGEGELLFPAPWGKNGQLGKNAINKALWGMGLKGQQTGHGFRGIASTALYDKWKTIDPLKAEYIEMQLAHVSKDKTKRAYNHNDYLEQRTAMMQWWGDYLERIATEPVATPSKVVAFPLAS